MYNIPIYYITFDHLIGAHYKNNTTIYKAIKRGDRYRVVRLTTDETVAVTKAT